ncbi:MAG: 3-isopropylmalate dehydrogenase [Sphingomonadales bacterium]
MKILMLPGDGVGPEVLNQARRVLDYIAMIYGLDIDVTQDLIGGASIDTHGVPATGQMIEDACQADAVLLGAVGGHKWENIDYAIRPERGLLELRKAMQVFANLRPAFCYPALAVASTLKAEVVSGFDMMIVRELTGGVYFGEPRGIENLGNGKRRGVNTHHYETDEILRVARVAFELARTRSGRVMSVDKANVMEAGLLWREEVAKLGADEYPDVQLDHMYADNCAMQLVRDPKQFDVILTDNLFGDILSDEASMLTGSIGMLPSASLGPTRENGSRFALYEPIHGSAPDIAGQGVANPIAAILSVAMALEYSLGAPEAATTIRNAVEKVLAGGMRTTDIMTPGMARVSTTVMTDAVLNQVEKAAREQKLL